MPCSIAKRRLAAFNHQEGRCYYCGLPMWLKQPAKFTAKHKISEGAASRFQCTSEHLKARQDGGTNSDGEPFISMADNMDDLSRKPTALIPMALRRSLIAWLTPAVSSLEACQTPAR